MPHKTLALISLAAFTLLSGLSAGAATGEADIGPVPEGRLPKLARPVEYRIALTVLPEKGRFSGHVEIDVDLPSPTRALWINGRSLAVTHAEARAGTTRTAIRYHEVEGSLGVARLDLASALPAGKATLIFDYEAPFSDSPSSLFHIKVGNAWYAWTQFESTDARGTFPSFDEPGYKTPFRVTLTTGKGQVTTSNAPEVRLEPAGPLERHVFETTRPLPTYLVQFGVGPFAVATGLVPPTPQRPKPLPLRIVATQANAGKLKYALDETPRIVELLEKYFDQPFPFSKLDQIASPLMRGAMENAGADTYADTILMLDPDASTAQRQEFGMVVAHELAHQWFGDLVTPEWWNDIWLNESFANWMGYRIGAEWRPELNIGVGAVDEALAAMSLDSLGAGRPIHQEIRKTGEIESAFDSVTYGKGGQVVAMIAAYMGDEKFRDGVRLHLSRHMYGNATSEEFFAALSEAAHDPRILAAMKSFVDQQGVPVVSITHGADGKLVASQKRSQLLGSDLPPTLWTIPLCMRVAAQRSCTLLDKASAPLGLEAHGPIMPNAGGVGYYRFALTDADWQMLFKNPAELTAGEALAASESLWAGFRAGDVPPARLIEAARALATHPDSTAAADGGLRLAGLRSRGMVPDAALADYRATMSSIYGPPLSATGMDLKARAYAGDPPDRQKRRSMLVELVAEEAHDPALRARLLEAARRYLGGDTAALDQSLIGPALYVYVEDGDLESARTLQAKLIASQDELFRAYAVYALGAADKPSQVRWLLDGLEASALRQTEKLGVVSSLLGQRATRDAAYEYLTTHFDSLSKDAGIFSFGTLMSMPTNYCSVERAQDIERTLGARERQYKRGSLELARTVERVRSCGLLKQKREAELATAFKPS